MTEKQTSRTRVHSTLRARAEEALSESEARFRKLHETMRDAFVSVDMKGRILEFNRAYEEMLGYTPEELRALTYIDLTPQAWHEMEARIVAEEVLPRGFSRIYEKEYRRKDGTIIPVELRTSLIRDSGGHPSLMWAIVREVTDRKKVEAALNQLNASLEQKVLKRTASLRESEEKFRQVTEAINQVFWMMDVSLKRVVYVSPAYERIWGRSCQSLYDAPDSWMEAIHPEDRPQVVESVRTEQNSIGYDLDYRIRRPDGTERWIHDRAFPIRDESGAVYRVAGVADDVTDQRKAELALEESERRLGGIIESAMDAIISVDKDLRVVLFNAAAEKMFQCPAAEALGRSLDKFIPARFHRAHDRHVRHFGESGATNRIMGRLGTVTGLRADGEEFPVEASISQVEAGSKKIFTVILRDIASRVRNEGALRRQAELLHLSHDAIIVWSFDGGIEYWNHGARRLYGYEAGESMGRRRQEHLRSLHPIAWPQIGNELRARGFWEGTLRQTAKNGDQVIVSARMQMMPDEAGRGMVILESNRDITDRQRLEEALLRAGEQERQRIGRDLHDGLGQEITAIALLNNLLQNSLKAKRLPEAANAERLAELLKHAAGEVRRISHGLQPVARDPDSLMVGIGNLVADANQVNGADCVFDCDGNVPVHNHESANHLYRIAQEALQNALRHGKPTEVSVSLARRDGLVILEIRDNGAGFGPEMPKGRGIGLNTMHYRAEAMNGFLELIRPPEGGALVRCTVPDPQLAPQIEKAPRSGVGRIR